MSLSTVGAILGVVAGVLGILGSIGVYIRFFFKIAEKLDSLVESVNRLTGTLDRLSEKLDETVERVAKLEGRLMEGK